MSGRPVPWASWAEWDELRAKLWSGDPFRQEEGLQQVCAWRLRGRLPLGIDVTAHLLDVRRADEDWQRAVATAAAASTMGTTAAADVVLAAGELPLRLRYSLPLIRMVNGISDSQQRGRVASSVAVLSDAAGLPRALVDVRHEATHSELPSLPLLRAAADGALAWLYDNYWEGQRKALAATAARICALLTCLAESWRAAITAGMGGGGGGGGDDDDDEEEVEEAAEGGPGAEAAGSGYSGAEGQRLRRQALSEIRSLVPPAFTHELLPPVLDCPLLLPPEGLQPQGKAQPRSKAQAPAANQPRQNVVEERAWRSVMKQILQWYPRLRLLLLQAAIDRLVETASAAVSVGAVPLVGVLSSASSAEGVRAESGAGSSDLGQRARACVRWILRLLPAGAARAQDSAGKKRQSGSKGAGRGGGKTAGRKAPAAAKAAAGTDAAAAGAAGSGSDPSLDGPLTRAQLETLLNMASSALAFGAQEDATEQGTPPGPVGAEEKGPEGRGAGDDAGAFVPSDAAAGRAAADLVGECVQVVLSALQVALALVTGAAAGKTQALRRKQGATAGGKGPQHAVDFGSAGADGPEPPQTGQEGQASGRPQVAGEQEQQQQRQGFPELRVPQTGFPERPWKWQRCTDWQRCAIGCLPCPLNPNGREPPLAPPPPPPPPPPPSTGDTGDATDAEATAGAATAAAEDGSAGRTVMDYTAEYYVEPEPVEDEVAAGLGDDRTRGQYGDSYGGDALYDDEADDEPGGDAAGTGAAGLFGVLLQGRGGEQGSSSGVGFLL